MSLNYIRGNGEMLDSISPLWEKQRLHHHNKTIHFKNRFASYTFNSRKESILKNVKDCLVEIVQDVEKDKYIGYCVSTLYNSNDGEIDSIYVEPEYRKMHVGHALMEDAIKWLEKNDVNDINIYVGVGNESVFDFYEKFGFKPFLTLLRRP